MTMAVKRPCTELEVPTIDPNFEAPSLAYVTDSQFKPVDLYDLPGKERRFALDSYVKKFAVAQAKEHDDNEWVHDSDCEISTYPSVCSVTTTKGERITLDAGEDKLFCSMNYSGITGRPESVSVYIRGKFSHRSPIDMAELLANSAEPKTKKTRFEKIKTGKGGWATYEVDEDCIM